MLTEQIHMLKGLFTRLICSYFVWIFTHKILGQDVITVSGIPLGEIMILQIHAMRHALGAGHCNREHKVIDALLTFYAFLSHLEII